MRLLLVSHSYVLADNRGKVRELAKLCRLTLLVPQRWPFDQFSAMVETESDTSFRLVSAPVRFAGRNLRHFYLADTVKQALRQSQPDVVLVEEEPASLSLMQWIPYLRNSPARLYFFAWENIHHHRPLISIAERINFRKAAGAIAGTREAEQLLRSKGFKKPVAVVPQMGVDAEATTYEFSRPGVGPFTIGFAGRLVEEKGVRLLFEAAGGLHGDWQLMIAGSGPLVALLADLACIKGWEQKVSWLGWLPAAELKEQLCRMAVLVLPSVTTPRWKEQFGRVLVEAMACGVPVIGSSSGAIPEVIADSGMVFPEGDVYALRAAIQLLMDNPGLRRDYTLRGARRASQVYSNRSIAQSVYNFLDSGSGA